jgi:hypothetical protein
VSDPRAGLHRFEIEARDGYLLVRCRGVMGSVEEAKRVQETIEPELQRAGHGLVLFDNRLTGDPATEAREAMWAWCRDCALVERVALLLESDLNLVRANMTALGKRSPVRSFNEETEASAWLLKRRTGSTALQP